MIATTYMLIIMQSNFLYDMFILDIIKLYSCFSILKNAKDNGTRQIIDCSEMLAFKTSGIIPKIPFLSLVLIHYLILEFIDTALSPYY